MTDIGLRVLKQRLYMRPDDRSFGRTVVAKFRATGVPDTSDRHDDWVAPAFFNVLAGTPTLSPSIFVDPEPGPGTFGGHLSFDGAPWESLHAAFAGIVVRPTFAPAGLDGLVEIFGPVAEPGSPPGTLEELASYVSIECPPEIDPYAVLKRLQAAPLVEFVYVSGFDPVPPYQWPPAAGDADYPGGDRAYLNDVQKSFGQQVKVSEEHYINFVRARITRQFDPDEGLLGDSSLEVATHLKPPSEGGIGALVAQSSKGSVLGTTGANVRLVDVEQGWAIDHEALLGLVDDALLKNTFTITVPGVGAANPSTQVSYQGKSHIFFGHGTASLSLLRSRGRLAAAIAPLAKLAVASCWHASMAAPDKVTAPDIAAAIAAAAVHIGTAEHGVILIEGQTRLSANGPFLPVEVEPAVRASIDALTLKRPNIVVVEAAGNGSYELDSLNTYTGKLFAPSAASSGAVIVGAGVRDEQTGEWRRASFSNYGSRIDCFASGVGVQAAGDGWLRAHKAWYTPKFGGTSAATAIVAGAAALIFESKAKTAAEVRAALSEGDTTKIANTHTKDPTDKIGVMPNVPAILAAP